MKGAGIDGVILDIECGKGSITGPNLAIVRDGFTKLTCDLKRKLKALVPGSVVRTTASQTSLTCAVLLTPTALCSGHLGHAHPGHSAEGRRRVRLRGDGGLWRRLLHADGL